MAKAKTETVKIRRAPKFVAFMATFGLIGAIVGILLGINTSILGYMFVYSTGIGAGVGAAVAVIVDWILSRRSTTAEATKLKG